MMNIENWISYRYLTSKKGGFLAFLNTISVGGVAIGVMALIVVTGVMTGFGNNLRDKIIGTTPHVQIEKETGIKDYDLIQQQLRGIPGIAASSPYVQGNVFLEYDGQAAGKVARGILPETERNITKINEYITDGRADEFPENGIIIGQELARYFGFVVGDEVTLIAPGSGMAGQGWRYQLIITGIFNSGMVDVDLNLVLIHLKKSQEIFNVPADRVSGIGVKLADPYQAGDIKNTLYQRLGYSYQVRSWIDANRNLFDALFLEKWGLFIILSFMVLVAAFNIVSTLMFTVMSKVHDIGILQSIGLPRPSIRRIFIKQGVYIGLMGTLWGVILGVGISYILKTYVKVPGEIYAIDHVPVELQLPDMLIIVGVAMVISYLATIYPAMKASRLQPVDALRYE
jgi:lipoprotein-releasing system permease protein